MQKVELFITVTQASYKKLPHQLRWGNYSRGSSSSALPLGVKCEKAAPGSSSQQNRLWWLELPPRFSPFACRGRNRRLRFSKEGEFMKWIIGLIILIPAIELYILLLSGKTIGVGYTILLILASGIIGAYFAKRQGIRAFREVSDNIKNAQAPGEAAINGIFIFIGSILVILPGFISDLLGFLLLFAPTRNLFKPLLYRWIRKKMKNGQVIVMKSS